MVKTSQPSCHECSICVCLADTDAGGVVYHATYLRFFDQARGEWLRTKGIRQRALYDDHGLALAVRKASVDYIIPARLDDILMIRTTILRARNVTIDFSQEIWTDDVLLATAEVRLACVDVFLMKAAPLPPRFRTLL